MHDHNTHLVELFEKNNDLPPELGKQIKAYMKKWDYSGLDALIDTHLYSETQIADKISHYLQISRVLDLRSHVPDVNFVTLLPYLLAKKYCAFIVSKGDYRSDYCTMVVADPTRKENIEAISAAVPHNLSIAVAEKSDIIWAINEYYPLKLQVPSLWE